MKEVEVEVQMYRETVVEPSANVVRVAGMFGLGVDEGRRVCVVPKTRVRLAGGWVVFVTGASGGGKSTLLSLLGRSLAGRDGVRVVWFDRVGEDGHGALVDVLECEGGLEGVMKVLGVAGLNDAFVMLRRVEELSDGQRYRFRLAQTLLSVGGGDGLTVVLADEFGSTLDRVTARVVARRLRRWVSGRGDVCFVAATAHDDLLEGLGADVVIEKGLGDRIEVAYRDEGEL